MTTEKHMFLRIMLVPVFYQHVGWLWESSLNIFERLNKTRNYFVPRLYRNQTKIYRLPKINKHFNNLGDLRAYIATEVAIL